MKCLLTGRETIAKSGVLAREAEWLRVCHFLLLGRRVLMEKGSSSLTQIANMIPATKLSKAPVLLRSRNSEPLKKIAVAPSISARVAVRASNKDLSRLKPASKALAVIAIPSGIL
jgi:hypothetical protein